jgi:hypothetical protein
MRTWTAFSGLLAALALSACNMVDDHAPTFGASSAASPLKPGEWQTLSHCETSPPPPGKVCTPFPDEGGPVGQLVVTPKTLLGRGASPDGPHISYVISPGSPMLMQVAFTVPDKFNQPSLRSGPHVFFVALEPTARDAAGQITSAIVWPVLCGPAPQPDSPGFDSNDERRDVTTQPFAGLAMEDLTCTAKDEASLRAAALASRSVFATTLRYEWAGDAPAN